MDILLCVIGAIMLLCTFMDSQSGTSAIHQIYFSLGFLSSYLIIGVGLILGYLKKINNNIEKLKSQNAKGKEEEK